VGRDIVQDYVFLSIKEVFIWEWLYNSPLQGLMYKEFFFSNIDPSIQLSTHKSIKYTLINLLVLLTCTTCFGLQPSSGTNTNNSNNLMMAEGQNMSYKLIKLIN
jgi:hypothetical protein